MKKLMAIALAVFLLACCAACGGTEAPVSVPVTDTPTTETTTEIFITTEVETTTEIETTTEEETSTEPETETEIETEPGTDAEPKSLSEKEILEMFNAATKKAVDSKAGYTKVRNTYITDLDFGLLGRFDIVKREVYGFFDADGNGIGYYESTVKKGTASDQLRASKWTMSDIKSAKAEPDGKGGYNVTIIIKDGGTRWSGQGGDDIGSGTKRSHVDNGPFCYGEDGDSRYDHKTSLNIYRAINDADDALTKDIGENTTNIKVTAEIDAQGRLQRLYGYMDMRVDVYHVTYLIVTLTNKYGAGHGEVTFSDFKY